MPQIVISIILFFAGSVLELNSNLGAEYSFQRHPEFIAFGLALQFAAVILFMVGLKRYFLSEILAALKDLAKK